VQPAPRRRLWALRIACQPLLCQKGNGIIGHFCRGETALSECLLIDLHLDLALGPVPADALEAGNNVQPLQLTAGPTLMLVFSRAKRLS
jgi:hypothetical protein